MLTLHIAPHSGRQQFFSTAGRQGAADICRGHLNYIGIIQNGDAGAVKLFQIGLLRLKSGALVGLAAAEGGDIGRAAYHLGTTPCVEGQEHIRSHQQPQFILGVFFPQLQQRIGSVALPLAAQFTVICHGALPHCARQQNCHFIALFVAGAACGQLLVGRDPCRDHQQFIKGKLLHSGAGQGHMTSVGRVECAAENTDSHAFLAFTGSILRLSFLC